jgi:hypothetical protein
MSHRAIFLPASVLPAEHAYGALLKALGSDADTVAKDLEVYATAEPPVDYSLDTEIAGILREADGRIEPERLADLLRALWRRAEQSI